MVVAYARHGYRDLLHNGASAHEKTQISQRPSLSSSPCLSPEGATNAARCNIHRSNAFKALRGWYSDRATAARLACLLRGQSAPPGVTAPGACGCINRFGATTLSGSQEHTHRMGKGLTPSGPGLAGSTEYPSYQPLRYERCEPIPAGPASPRLPRTGLAQGRRCRPTSSPFPRGCPPLPPDIGS